MLLNESKICLTKNTKFAYIYCDFWKAIKMNYSAGDSNKSMSPKISEGIARIFYETWTLFFPQIFIRGMQYALLELLGYKEGSNLLKTKTVNKFFNKNNYVLSLITAKILALDIA